MKDIKPLARKSDLVVQEASDEVLVFDLLTHKASCLNSTAAMVWSNCNGSNSVSEIAKVIGDKTNTKVSDDVVWLAVDQLSRSKLLTQKIEAVDHFGGLTRRAFAKKVGLTSMIALPVIASLIAPPAVYANSACINGGSCTCDTLMGNANFEICSTSGPSGVPCTDVNCLCERTNQGNAAGTCVP